MPPTDRSRWLNLAAIVLLCLLLTGVGMLTPVMRLVDAIGGVTWRRPLDAGWAPALLLADALVLPVIFAIRIIFWVSVARDSEIDRNVSDEVVVRWRTSVPIRFAFNLMAVGFALMIVYVLIGVSVVLSKDRPADATPSSGRSRLCSCRWRLWASSGCSDWGGSGSRSVAVSSRASGSSERCDSTSDRFTVSRRVRVD